MTFKGQPKAQEGGNDVPLPMSCTQHRRAVVPIPDLSDPGLLPFSQAQGPFQFGAPYSSSASPHDPLTSGLLFQHFLHTPLFKKIFY